MQRISSSLAIASWLLLVGCMVEDPDADLELSAEEQELSLANGIITANGMRVGNGIQAGNGFHLPNGLVLPNGIHLGNGIQLGNGINAPNGIQLGNGMVDPPSGSDLDKFLDCNCGTSCATGSCSTTNQRKAFRYLVECAMPASRTVTLRHNGAAYATVPGVGGLAPTWANCTGSSTTCNMTVAEQEKVTACLLARINAKGVTVTIGMYGPYTGFNTNTSTDATYDTKEATFVGNLFVNPPNVHMINHYPDGTERNARACSLANGCDPLTYQNEGPGVTCAYNSTGRWATSCTIGTRTWLRPVTVWIHGFGPGAACTYDWQCGLLEGSRLQCVSGTCERVLSGGGGGGGKGR